MHSKEGCSFLDAICDGLLISLYCHSNIYQNVCSNNLIITSVDLRLLQMSKALIFNIEWELSLIIASVILTVYLSSHIFPFVAVLVSWKASVKCLLCFSSLVCVSFKYA